MHDLDGVRVPDVAESRFEDVDPAPLALLLVGDRADGCKDTFNGEAVNFGKTFLSTVSASDAFPQGGDEGLVPLLNLQLWGLPTSKPAMR